MHGFGPPGAADIFHGIKLRVKRTLFASPVRLTKKLGSFHQLFELKDFVDDENLRAVPYFANRFELYEQLHAQLINPHAIDYLEFGVFTGATIRKWASMNTVEASRFYGFDTFEGLPEPWVYGTGIREAGCFSTGGKTPDIPDRRVRFIKGLFQDTLSSFAKGFRPQNKLVVHCDADLYSSTLYVLATLHEFLAPGTIIIFDEFGTVDHEFRAFVDYREAFRMKLRPVARVGEFFEQVAFSVDPDYWSATGRRMSRRRPGPTLAAEQLGA